MSDKKREEMKENLKNNFDRAEYERRLLSSLKKANSSNNRKKFPNVGDRGGR